MASIPNSESISNELDELSARILDLMNQYIVCKTNIENHIRSGCLDLAKARYIKGNRNISSLQLPSEDAIGVTARYRVLSSTNDRDSVTTFEGVENEVEDLTEGLENVSLADNDDSSSKARRVIRFSNDPLKWFGILVPQDLRQSKKTFENCLEIVIECSNIQSELIHCMQKYETLKKMVSCDS
jgi:hypothetical protein